MKQDDKSKKITIKDSELEDLGFVEAFDAYIHPNGDFIDQKGNKRNAFEETEKA